MKKMLNKKGFTLMEMLIVVAIIVILVAISVPTFTANLDKAKAATDDANMRAAKAVAVVFSMDSTFPEKDAANNVITTYYYDIDAGALVKDEPEDGYGESSANKDKVIKIVYSGNTPTLSWD